MASGSETTATFAIGFDGSKAVEGATAAADALQALRDRITKGQDALRDYQTSLRSLRGKTDEVTAAKNILKKQLDEERAAITAANLALLKQGSSLEKLATAEQNAAKAAAKLVEDEKNAARAAQEHTKKLEESKKKLDDLKKKAQDEGLEKLKGELESTKTALAGLGAVATAVAAAVGAGLAALIRFVVTSADAARSAGLLRQAAMNGNAQWGKNFGEQVEALARKVPTARADIQALGTELAKSRIGGQVWVDTLNAVTQASAALGDDAGNKLKEFITRGKQFNRFQLNPLEMVGTGVEFDDVAKALATSMKVGLKDARAALFEGRVKLEDGAKAMRDAVEKKVGGINLRQMLSLDNLTKKLGESFDRLTRGIDLEPMLKSFKELADIFDTTTVSGQALKQIIEVFGVAFGKTITGATPIAKKFIYGMIIGAQQLVISYLQLRNTMRNTFGDTKVLGNVDLLGKALQLGKGAAVGMALAVAAVGLAVGAAMAPFVYAANLVTTFFAQLGDLAAKAMAFDWGGLGRAIVDGIVNGLTKGAERLKGAVKSLAEIVKKTFTGVMDIHSPSKVAEKWGVHIDEGVERGVDKGAGGVQSAVEDMAPSAPKGRVSLGGGGGPVINLTINVEGSSGEKIAAELKSSGVVDQIIDAITDALRTQGTGTPSYG